VAKPEWGTKRQCSKCGARFYDLGNDPILCPACGVEHVPEIILKSRAPQAEEAPKPVKVAVKVAAEENVDIDDDEEEDEDLDIEDDDDDAVLGEMDDDEEDEPVGVSGAGDDD